MKLINQNDYPDVLYITNTSHKFDEDGDHTTIKDSGCGICTAMMIMEFYYPDIEFTMEQAIQLSYDCEANHGLGTDYRRYTEALCNKFALKMERTDQKEVLKEHLKSGNIAVVNVGGDHDEHLGIFSNMGHYILVDQLEEDEIRVLDPCLNPEKYTRPYRAEKVRVEGQYVYSTLDVLMADTTNRKYPVYMFSKA